MMQGTPTVALYASAARPGHVESALESSARYLVLCLEDGTPEDRKAEARHLVAHALDEYRDRPGVTCVRINGCDTAHWEEDIGVLFGAPVPPSRVRLPMARDVADVQRTLQEISKYGRPLPSRYLEVMVESAECCHALDDILQACGTHIAAVTVGGEDLLASLGDADALDRAKMSVIQGARRHGIACLETTYMQYKDLAGLEFDTLRALQRGFAGRSVVHPSHVPICERLVASHV